MSQSHALVQILTFHQNRQFGSAFNFQLIRQTLEGLQTWLRAGAESTTSILGTRKGGEIVVGAREFVAWAPGGELARGGGGGRLQLRGSLDVTAAKLLRQRTCCWKKHVLLLQPQTVGALCSPFSSRRNQIMRRRKRSASGAAIWMPMKEPSSMAVRGSKSS